jgi:hypothetical protein
MATNVAIESAERNGGFVFNDLMQILASSLQLVALESHGGFSRILEVASQITSTRQH